MKLILRLVILILIAIITYIVLLSSFLWLSGKIGKSDDLKQDISLWVILCIISLNIFNFIISNFFTKDLIWKYIFIYPTTIKNFSKIWQLDISITTLKILFVNKNIYIIIYSFVCLILFIISVIISYWLNYCSVIVPHISMGDLKNYSFYTYDNNTSKWQESFYNILNMYSTSSLMGMVNRTTLHYEDEEYYWSPWLNDNIGIVNINNINVFSIKPICKKVNSSNLKITKEKNFTQFGFYTYYITMPIENHDNIKIYGNSSDDDPLFINPNNNLIWQISVNRRLWKMMQIIGYGEDYENYNYNKSYILHVFGGTTIDKNSTFIINRSDKINYYINIFNCSYILKGYDIDGTINKSSIDRLNIQNKKLSSLDSLFALYVKYSYIGFFKAFYNLQNDPRSEYSPMEKWIIPNKSEGFISVSEESLNKNMADIISYMGSPNILSDTIIKIEGNEMISDFTIILKKSHLIISILIHCLLVISIIFMYIILDYKTKIQFIGDSILEYSNILGFENNYIINIQNKTKNDIIMKLDS